MIYNNIKIELPKNVEYIINVLEKAGFEAFAVGGCVRDSLLGVYPSDYDITTNALPVDIKKLFPKTIDTGIQHGTVSVLLKEKNVLKTYEVTTYRIDGEYEDNRHPREVKFVTDLVSDLRRRDFTINAFAYNHRTGLVDEFCGLEDLHNKTIRAVGDATERYNEDALRMMRAIRFASQLDFDIEKSTYDAISYNYELLKNVSKERINVELTKTLIGKKPKKSELFFESKLSNYITEDFNKINCSSFYITKKKYLAFASFLYELYLEDDFDKALNIKKKILTDLKFDNNTIKNVIYILRYKNKICDVNQITDLMLKKIICDLDYELTYELFDLMSFKNNVDYTTIVEKINYYKINKECISIKDLDIDGNVLIKLGFRGKEVGDILQKLLNFCHKNNLNNNKKILMEEALKWKISK